MMMSSSSTPRSSCGGGGAGSSNNSSNSNNSLGIDTGGGGAGSCVVATTTTTNNSSTTTTSSSHPCSLFTPHQWQELEHQALVFKHFISGVPVPPYLLSSVRRSLLDSSSLSKPFSLSSSSVPQQNQQSSFGAWGSTCFQMGFTDLSSGVVSGGRRQDPEPGRCRRTDGKKWRCSKEAAYPDSKYCEKHMHRGKHRAKANKQQPPLPPQQQQQQSTAAAAAAAGFTTSPTSTLLTPSLLLSKTSSNSSSITCSSSSPSSSATFQNVNVPLNCYNFYNQNSHHPTISDYTNAFNYIQNTQQYPSSSAAAAGTGNYTTSSNTNYQGDGGGGEGSSSPYNYNFLTSNYGNNPGLQSHQGSCRDDNNNLLLGSGSRDLQFHHDKINSSLSRQYWCSSGVGNGEERSFFPVADETCSRNNKVGRGGDHHHHHHQGDQLSGGVYLGYTANNNSTIKEGIGGVDEDSNGDEVVVKDDGKNPYHQFFGEIWPVKNASNWVGGDEDGSGDLNTNSNNNATAVVGCSTSTQLSISIPPHNSYCRGRDG